MLNPKHVGTAFDTFLEEEGLLEEAEATAAKRVLAFQITQAMEEQKLSKAAMAAGRVRFPGRKASPAPRKAPRAGELSMTPLFSPIPAAERQAPSIRRQRRGVEALRKREFGDLAAAASRPSQPWPLLCWLRREVGGQNAQVRVARTSDLGRMGLGSALLLHGRLAEVTPRIAAHPAGAGRRGLGIETHAPRLRPVGVEEVVTQRSPDPLLAASGVVAAQSPRRRLPWGRMIHDGLCWSRRSPGRDERSRYHRRI